MPVLNILFFYALQSFFADGDEFCIHRLYVLDLDPFVIQEIKTSPEVV